MNLETKLSTENQNISEIHWVAEKIKHTSAAKKNAKSVANEQF